MNGINNLLDLENNLTIEKFEELKSSLKEYVDKNNIILNISSKADDLISMIIDYVNGDYKDINKTVVPFLAFSILYFILPSDFLKDVVGEKTLLRSVLIFSVSYYLLNTELKKYRQFLEDNKVVITTDYGDIVYYRHRIKEEL